MVKIKAGYIMNPREKAEFERVNALPRKTAGTVAYYFKPQTKYPPRIYVFMHAEIWQDRNRRPMGLHTAFPFLTRPMNREEIEYHHFDIRQCYHQYGDWGKLIYAEEKEAAELDKEQPGTGTAFLQKLQSFRARYPLGTTPMFTKPAPGLPESETTLYMRRLIQEGGSYPAAKINELLREEQQGQKRPGILILLRELYKEQAGERKRPFEMTIESIEHKVSLSENRSRRNFVRRVFAANPLFALQEIRNRYPAYQEKLLNADLKRRKPKPKKAKRKPITDLRRCQLLKLAAALWQESDERKYHALCERIAILSEAHRRRLPIPITVKLQGRTQVYSFNWKTREEVVKSFVSKANAKGMTHKELEQTYNGIISSNYSF